MIGLEAADTETGDGHLPGEEEFWSLDEAIPNDSAAVIALVEHRWATGTRSISPAARKPTVPGGMSASRSIIATSTFGDPPRRSEGPCTRAAEVPA